MNKTKDEISFMSDKEDCVLFELEKELGLIAKGNCNVLEHLVSKPEITGPGYLKLKEISTKYYNHKEIMNSYLGMAKFNYMKYVRTNTEPLVKKYLYVYRALMAGLYFHDHKTIEPNIQTLNKYFNYDLVDELIKLKTEGTEKATTDRNREYDVQLSYLMNYFENILKNERIGNILDPESESIALRENLNNFLLNERTEEFLTSFRVENLEKYKQTWI